MQILNQLQDERMENDTNKLLLIGDRVKLSQVLRNLVANALKFTEEGGQIIVSTKWETMSSPEIPSQPSHFMDRCHPCLKRSCRQRRNGSHNIGIQEQSSTLANKYVPAGQVSISVTDTGAGLSAEHIQQLFQEGVQFNPNNLQGGQGSGLGLCITKGIVDAHCGHLLVSSEGEGHGTTFKVMLPIFLPVASMVNSDHVLIEDDICARPNEGETPAFDSVDVLPKKEALDVLLQSTVYERFHNLLVVDDSAVNRKMMCRSLQAVGFRCFQAVDGLECVEIVRKVLNNEHEPINLILMDYEMPGMNGPTACAALSTLKCDIPVIGVTGNVLNEDKQTFLEHGAIEVLQKPFLISTFESILKRRIESNNKK
jgi:CheY-like chemotaxis protein